MTYLTAILIVAASGLVASAAVVLVRRRVRLETLRRNHEVGSAVFLQMGVVFAVLLAFVFTEVWSEYNTAAEAIANETSSLVAASRLARGLPDAARERLRASIVGYVKAVIADEWPAMANIRTSNLAEDALDELWTRVRDMEANSERENTIRGQILEQLTDAGKHRSARVFQASSGLPGIIWILLILFAVVLAGFLLFFGADYVWSQALFAGVFAGSVAFILVLIRLLDYPFAGALRLSPELFERALVQVARGVSAY